MGNFVDISGLRYGKLVVSRKVENIGKKVAWLCECDCGEGTTVTSSDLRSGHTKSCGCLKGGKITHGMNRSPEHSIWCQIKGRCYNKNSPAYSYYGGRGIKVCDRWRDSFEAFFHDMGDRPSGNHSIDRIDNDGDYTPENCRWATPYMQANNARSNVRITYQGETHTVTQWARKLAVSPQTIFSRIRYGWTDPEKLLGK